MLNIPITSDQSTETKFSFTITGPSGTVGFANMTISKNAIPYESNPVVYIDGNQAPDQGSAQDVNNYYVWFTMNFSIHQLTVQFAAPHTNQVGSPGLEYAIIIPVAAIILVPTAFVVKRSKRKTSKREIKTKDFILKSKETKISNTTNANKEAESIKSSPPINEPKEKLSSIIANQELSSKQNAVPLEQKTSTLSCNHHFGYLKNLPKSTEIPNECYFCTKLIECKRKT